MTPRERDLAEALAESVQRTDEELRAIQLARAIVDAHNDLVARHAAEVSDLRTQLADLQAVLDQETRAKLEACEALERQTKLTDLADLSATAHRCVAESLQRRIDKALTELKSAPMYDAKSRCAETLRGE